MNYRTIISRFVIGISILIIAGCTSTQPKSEIVIHKRLRKFIDTIKIVNTHEHQGNPAKIERKAYNFYTILSTAYLRNDLGSAGNFTMKDEDIDLNNLDALWDSVGTNLSYCRATSFYSHLISGFQILYGFNDSYFTRENINKLSAKIAKRYRNRDAWFDKAFKKAGFDVMLVDRYWDSFSVEHDTLHTALVFHINSLIISSAKRSSMTGSKNVEIYKLSSSPFKDNPYALAESEGFTIKTLDNYLAFADRLFKKFVEHKAVCLKTSMAYVRTLDYEDVPYDKAKKLFARNSNTLSDEDKKALEDFMFHWLIKKAIEYNLPIQIHTGYGPRWLEWSEPMHLENLFIQYPQATFILFHGGFPWVGEYTALAKQFPNVYLDLVWLPQISRETAVRCYDEMLDCVPYNKFFWGGDCHTIEETVGSLEFGKSVVAEVFTKRITRGLMTEEVARDIALKLFRDNAVRVFRLQGKLGRTF
jgi:uncharacterized protein